MAEEANHPMRVEINPDERWEVYAVRFAEGSELGRPRREEGNEAPDMLILIPCDGASGWPQVDRLLRGTDWRLLFRPKGSIPAPRLSRWGQRAFNARGGGQSTGGD